MKRKRNTKFKVKDKASFFKTINPSYPTLDKKIGKACADSADQLLNKIRAKRLSDKYESYFSTSHDNIYRYLELSKGNEVEFTVKVLNTLLCFFFFKKPSKYQYSETHTEQNLRDFFNHITISNGKYEDIETFNRFMNDLALIEDSLTHLYHSFSIELNENYEFSIIENERKEIVTPKDDIQINGVLVIDKTFCNHIKTSAIYSEAEFYIGKQNNCQWFGIIHDFDIVRKEYKQVKQVAQNAFNNSVSISAIVHGAGGTGKSTLLRRLAIELQEESFVTLWADKREFLELYNHGIKNIKAYSNINFLLIINDWYRLIDTELESKARSFLIDIQQISNVRIIIGDRKIVGKSYLKFINKDNIFELNNNQNKNIISEIVTKNPDWKPIAKKLFKDEDKRYNSSLFILLFILVRNDEKYKSNLVNPTIIFQNIVASDISSIYKHSDGLANMLFFLASIYSSYKVTISYDAFLKIADYLDKGKNNISNTFHNLDGNSHVHRKLRNYIYIISEGQENKARFSVRFNHDMLASLGILNIINTVDGLNNFDDISKLEIVRTLPHIRENDYSVSLLLSIFLTKEPQIFKNQEEKIKYIDTLLAKGNKNLNYLEHLHFFDFEDQKWKWYIKQFLKHNLYPVSVWIKYLKKDKKNSSYILEKEDVLKLPNSLISFALKHSEDQEKKQEIVSKILSPDFYNDFSYELLNTALKISTNKAMKQDIANKILLGKKHYRRDCFYLVYTALNFSNDRGAIKSCAESTLFLLTRKRVMPKKTILKLLRVLTEQEKEEFISKLLKHDNLYRLNQKVIHTVIKISTNENDRTIAANHILKHKKYLKGSTQLLEYANSYSYHNK